MILLLFITKPKNSNLTIIVKYIIFYISYISLIEELSFWAPCCPWFLKTKNKLAFPRLILAIFVDMLSWFPACESSPSSQILSLIQTKWNWHLAIAGSTLWIGLHPTLCSLLTLLFTAVCFRSHCSMWKNITVKYQVDNIFVLFKICLTPVSGEFLKMYFSAGWETI